jgi:hypothetical protein
LCQLDGDDAHELLGCSADLRAEQSSHTVLPECERPTRPHPTENIF